ncbi:CorA metal ion transporter [Thecaphora frezii]
MSSPRPFYASHTSGRTVSPPNSDDEFNDARRSTDHEHHQLQQDIDAARQMSKVRGRESPPPSNTSASAATAAIASGRGVRSRKSSVVNRTDADHDADAEPYYHEGMNRSPSTALPHRSGPSAAAAARFYQQHRHGSNASLDSQQHFIDHRNQAHSLSTHASSPLASRAKSSLSRTPMRSPTAYFTRNTHDDNDNDNDNEQAVADDDHSADFNHQTLGARRTSRQSNSARSGSHHDHAELYGGNRASSPRTMSRRPSMLEDDVCFPMHEQHLADTDAGGPIQDHNAYDGREVHGHDDRPLPPGYPFNFDIKALEDFAAEERERIGMSSSWTNEAPPSGLRIRNQAAQKGSAPAYGFSPDSDDATFYSRRPRKLSASAGALGSSKYQRKLALFEGGGSAPPPVAGAGASTSIMGGGLAAGSERSKSNSRTPLLDKDTLPSYHGTSSEGRNGPTRMPSSGALSAPNPGRARSGTGAYSSGEKPYRFTFYSNALPSTIHARHLAELPAEGQTFEELFNGRPANTESPPQESNAESDSRGASHAPSRAPTINNNSARGPSSLGQALAGLSRLEGTTAPATGAHTPQPPADGPTNASRPLSALGLSKNGINPPARALPGGGIRMDQDPEANTWWLDVLSPTDQEMKLLSRVFGIHPLTTEDILMEETREKIELFRNYYLVCFRSFDQDPYSPTYLEPLNMYIIVFREGTLSFHFRGTPHPQNVRRRIKQLKDYINVTSDWISYALIDDITDAFGPLIQSIEYEVDSIDELVLILKEAEQSDMLRRIGTCRKKVMGLLRLMGNKADVVKGLAKRCNENWSVAPKSDIGLYLSDIQDHLITMTQNLNHYEKILSRSHSNYLAQISIEMTDANNQINDVLSKLTALGTVIVPMNVITGLWGMNVHVPGQDDETSLRWFGGICAVMVVLAVSGYIATTRYLERSR